MILHVMPTAFGKKSQCYF